MNNSILFVDLCNTLANINGELNKRGHGVSNAIYPSPNLPEDVWEDHSIYLNADPIQSVIDVVKNLASQCKRIVYLTARPQAALPISQLWLLRNGLPMGDLMASKGEEKGTVIEKFLRAQNEKEFLLVDDAPREILSTTEMIARTGFKGQVFAPDWEYNSGLPVQKRLSL